MPTLMRAIAEEERLMPHFHLSAQSGDDLILKRMKRRHSRADTIAFCDAVRPLSPRCRLRRRPDRRLSHRKRGDVRKQPEAGGRCRPVAAACLSLFARAPARPRRRMPQLPRALVKERAARLRAKGEAALAARLDGMTGARHTVLMERGGIGRTPCFTPVEIGDAPHGSFLPVTHHRPQRATRLTGMPRMRTFGEAPPPPTFFDRLKTGLAKTGLGEILTKKKLDAATVAELEEALIRADMGAAQAAKTGRRRRQEPL